MKLTDINIRFTPNRRPEVTVKFDALVPSATEAQYKSRHHKETDTWCFRCDLGDCVLGGANLPGTGAARIRLADGTHSNMRELSRTNAVALNNLFPHDPPTMDCMIQEGAGLHHGFVNALSVAKYLWLTRRDVALAVIQWPSGLKLYEPVQIADDGEPVPNRGGDKVVFLCTPQSPTAELMDLFEKTREVANEICGIKPRVDTGD